MAMAAQFPNDAEALINSGVIRLDSGVVDYASRDYGSFSVPLDEIAVIGEYTTDQGPAVDDWFHVFVHKNGVDWFEASMYAEGSEDFYEKLATALGSPMEIRLAASVQFESRVIWPPAIAGRPLFEFSPAAETGLLGRLRSAILPNVTRSLSADVLNAVRHCG